VEEFASQYPQARKVILAGCEQCPDSEDVWLEAARLHTDAVAKTLLANAVMHLPTSGRSVGR
jgi:pre-mRNA-processing factor 6